MANDGVLVVDKEKGMTSHDVVSAVRRRFGVKKVGHAGTLDPNATGVLVLLLGKATKASVLYSSDEKEYEARIKLGERTDTGDREGVVVATSDALPGEDEVRRVVMGFEGESDQVPPMVSAKKVKGKKLYELARKGIVVEREPVRITISDMEITSVDMPFFDVRMTCTKGTYVRQLADDIGTVLGCGAHLWELRRTRSGKFRIEDAVGFQEVMEMSPERLNEVIIRL
ncbi:MAG: tRNA pseudouridine(55) synthase TruB [Candidatus Omnitrophica bacterium]|nr:tRNA pseudouridine(55) synthase TruB [Candidatus Omnitrophota bacterium]MDD5488671.1 tRNA pseudouridine(55) synthase TruB [Candidatus Omnitrophota bacterium]